jgi:hypothetical protein
MATSTPPKPALAPGGPGRPNTVPHGAPVRTGTPRPTPPQQPKDPGRG